MKEAGEVKGGRVGAHQRDMCCEEEGLPQVIDSFVESERLYKQTLPFLSSSQECLAARLGNYEMDSKREN